MALPVYDFRTDVRNILVTPEIRSRFLKFEVGTVAQRHSHDLGHEIFLILSGRAEFEIDGEKAELGPGQMCIALANQYHQVRVLGDEWRQGSRYPGAQRDVGCPFSGFPERSGLGSGVE